MWHDHWRKELQPNAATEKGVAAVYQLPADAFWFDGHFPGNPILPGVAQLALVLELIQSTLAQPPLKVITIRRVRFKQMIGPNDPITVTIAEHPVKPDCYDFQIEKEAEMACSGMITVAPLSEDND